MKLHAQPFAALALLGVFFSGCDRPVEGDTKESTQEQLQEHSDPFAVTEGEVAEDEQIPKTLNEALDLMMAGLTDEDRKFIEAAGDEYATSAHFGSGMGMRNSWGLWGDSPLSRYFSRLGIYHADDMSAIINEAFSRQVRGKDIQLEKLVQYYRDYWEKQDIVAPLNLNCPHCGKEMLVDSFGTGVSKTEPDRFYFFGICPEEQEFLFYHKDGWQRRETINSEQAGAGQPATRPESDSKGSDKPQPEAEGRSQ
jgi:hypothetical protein